MWPLANVKGKVTPSASLVQCTYDYSNINIYIYIKTDLAFLLSVLCFLMLMVMTTKITDKNNNDNNNDGVCLLHIYIIIITIIICIINFCLSLSSVSHHQCHFIPFTHNGLKTISYNVTCFNYINYKCCHYEH